MRAFNHIAVLLGGWSAERPVSLVTGAACAKGLREAGYRVTEIDPGSDATPDLSAALTACKPDAVFNALHGRWGEDGCVQGVLECLGLPYTHSGVLASALAMDKERAKAVFRQNGLPVAESVLAAPGEIATRHVLPAPYVVKPFNEGSSVGVHLVMEGANRFAPVDTADAPELLMVESYVAGRELTVSVMGAPGEERALGVTEIIAEGWYDYDAKYKPGGSRHVIPADLPADVTRAAGEMAVRAHQALGCRGLSRADFRYDDTGGPGPEKLVLLEVNTQPGMTPTSLSPEQAEHCGMGFPELVAWMVEDASCQR